MKTTTALTEAIQATIPTPAPTPLALRTAVAFNGTVVNTGTLFQLFDGVCAYVGLLSQDKTQFFPLHGIANQFRFKPEYVLTVHPDFEFWVDENPFLLVQAEREARKSEHPESVSNADLWNEVVQNLTPNRVRFHEMGVDNLEEGWVMHIENDHYHILWDTNKGAKLPLFTYSVTDPRIEVIYEYSNPKGRFT